MRDVVCVECGSLCELIVPLVVRPIDGDRPVLATECGYWECTDGCMTTVQVSESDVSTVESVLSGFDGLVQFGSIDPHVLASLPVVPATSAR